MDVALVLIVTLLVTVLVAVLAPWIRRDGGPAFYAQERVGRGGRVFCMWKRRSIVVDADQRLLDLLEQDPQARQEWVETQKLCQDLRTTPLGWEASCSANSDASKFRVRGVLTPGPP